MNPADDPEAARRRDRDHLWHIWSPVTAPMTRRMLVQGTGPYVTDIEGREYLDASSLNLTCGYALPEIAQAIGEQASRFHGYDLSVATHVLAGAVAQRVAALMPPELSRTLLTNSGTEGCEAAVLIAAMYARIRGTPRTRLVTFDSGYHGSTVLARSLSGLPHLAHPFQEPLPVTRVPLPTSARDMRRPETLRPLLDSMRRAFAEDPDSPPLAVVIEPLLNVGGGVVLPDGFLAGLRELCDTNGVLLIIDEVSTGYGRTGRMFAFQRENVVPDIVVSSKGLASGYAPIAAVSVRETIYKAFADDEYLGGLRFGQTTSGHALAAAAALATLDLLDRENLVERSDQLGGLLLRKLEAFLRTGGITDVRGLGLFVSLEFAEEAEAVHLVAAAEENGLLLRRQGRVVMAVPPLTSDETVVQSIAETIGKALEVAA
ncbi:aspartate aminotransferase family protein [Streptomyces sp. NEAU-Y11]|uniref:aminotransferase family protein n=1 Tax=Streptomyces cucumeris TaxID=2962890 RepID=UPI0020C924AB|nr:aspartate aminotransferase family protein [Streptomyces sp. NEAU-Y11]MCP9211497.1 aspartate aminotransferase family protein [Streptomyces sp. NEAU-Y11]